MLVALHCVTTRVVSFIANTTPNIHCHSEVKRTQDKGGCNEKDRYVVNSDETKSIHGPLQVSDGDHPVSSPLPLGVHDLEVVCAFHCEANVPNDILQG